jgi:hypothetical protein
MTSLPLSFRVKNAVVEKHQLEGTDPSDRYFNRMVPIKRVEGGYNGSIMYEALTLDSQVHRTVQETTKDIVDQLRGLGFIKMWIIWTPEAHHTPSKTEAIWLKTGQPIVSDPLESIPLQDHWPTLRKL